MRKYFSVAALIVLTAGCAVERHGLPYGQPAWQTQTPPQAQARPRHTPPPANIVADEQMADAEPPMGGNDTVWLYFKEARQNLLESRSAGYITNDEYAKLLEKLQKDIRDVLMEEAKGHHPVLRRQAPAPRHEPKPMLPPP